MSRLSDPILKMPRVDLSQPHYVHNRGVFTAIRADPRDDSEPVRDALNHRVVVPDRFRFHPIHVSEDDNDNNFVLVTVAQAGALYLGYVARKHMMYLIDVGSWPYHHLSDAVWWTLPWIFGRANCRAEVLHSTQEVDIDSVQLTADQAAKYFSSGYTYVKLEIGTVWNDARRCQACRSHHISLAYASPMSADQRTELLTLIQSALAMWFNTMPLARPNRLRMRRCRVHGEQGGLDWRTQVLWKLDDDVIESLASTGRIDPLAHFHGRWVRTVVAPTVDDWKRIAKRDRDRLAEATDRAQHLLISDQDQLNFQMHGAPLVELSVAVPASGFGHDGPQGPSEAVHDLLAYLIAEISFYPPAHFVIPRWDPIAKRDKEKVQPPFVHGLRSLHVSRQSNWQLQW